MHIPTRTLVAACALAAALLVVGGCGGGDRDKASNGSTGGELFLQPVAERGPDPFTASTDTSTTTPSPVTRTPQSTPTAARGVRSFSGATPGLYGGVRDAGSCDVEKQIRFLDADRARTRAFAEVSGISPGSVQDYLRQLTPVVLRADTGVTNHGFGAGHATGFQAVLQAGTAVLVDNRGVPRVRCACGNPLGRPTPIDGNPVTRGRPWSGYRPGRFVVVTPASLVITAITIVDVDDNSWIERPVGHDGHRHDHVVPPPDGLTPTPKPEDSTAPQDPSADASPDGRSPSPEASASDCVTPAATRTTTPGTGEGTPGESAAPTGAPTDGAAMDVSRPDRSSPPPAEPSHCHTATATEPGTTPAPSGRNTAPPTDTAAPGRSGSPEPSAPRAPSDEPGTPSEDTGTDGPDAPDGGGLIPDGPTGPDGVFDVSTDGLDS
ncbi:DUF6777 domain-containing protein [Streptomyces sp. NPDC002742]|uniref:DUF6777 domain-containing protein n=1 Tax=Streptomyces sp. NPDC002742 TaxID=3364663 RepID=UPI0036BBB2C6